MHEERTGRLRRRQKRKTQTRVLVCVCVSLGVCVCVLMMYVCGQCSLPPTGTTQQISDEWLLVLPHALPFTKAKQQTT